MKYCIDEFDFSPDGSLTPKFRGWRLVPTLVASCRPHCGATPRYRYRMRRHISRRFAISFEYIRSEKSKVTRDQKSLIERNYFIFRRMFGLIRYKSDDFSENPYSNSEICVVMSLLVSSIMWNIREYYLHELSELINLDKSWNWWANVGTHNTLTMSCYARIKPLIVFISCWNWKAMLHMHFLVETQS